MEISSKEQMQVFLICILSGMLCGVFFDIQRFLRKLHSAGKVRTMIEDVLLAIVSIATVLGFGLRFNNGEIRYYQVAGSISGVLLYAAFLSRITMKIFDVLRIVIRKIILVPLIKIYLLVKKPIKRIAVLLKKVFSALKRRIKKVFSGVKKRRKHLKKRMKML